MVDGSNGISIIIRTLNEERYLGSCLRLIFEQNIHLPFEVVVVDSGSSDNTVKIARDYKCNVIKITKAEFSFGRALNIGIAHAKYKYIVSISAHCIPVDRVWLSSLVGPLINDVAELVYGAQDAAPLSRSSEISYFSYRYRGRAGIKNASDFNNGNSAFLRSIWVLRNFDEMLPAQEDIEFSRWHMKNSSAFLYFSSSARVVHYHNDKNKTLYSRLYREFAVEFYLGHRGVGSLLLFFCMLPRHLISDLLVAQKKRVLLKAVKGVLAFRLVQSIAFLHALLSYEKFVTEARCASR